MSYTVSGNTVCTPLPPAYFAEHYMWDPSMLMCVGLAHSGSLLSKPS